MKTVQEMLVGEADAKARYAANVRGFVATLPRPTFDRLWEEAGEEGDPGGQMDLMTPYGVMRVYRSLGYTSGVVALAGAK